MLQSEAPIFACGQGAGPLLTWENLPPGHGGSPQAQEGQLSCLQLGPFALTLPLGTLSTPQASTDRTYSRPTKQNPVSDHMETDGKSSQAAAHPSPAFAFSWPDSRRDDPQQCPTRPDHTETETRGSTGLPAAPPRSRKPQPQPSVFLSENTAFTVSLTLTPLQLLVCA